MRTPRHPAGAWASEGELAVSAYNSPAHAWEIQRVDLQGRRIRLAPHPPLPLDGAWSPDGRRIAFSGGDDAESFADDPDLRANDMHFSGVYTMNSKGKDVRLIRATRPDIWPFVPSWSPDGTKVAFSADGGVWTVGANGTGARRVVRLGDKFGIPVWSRIAWSADGKRLAFAGSRQVGRDSFDSGIYTVRAGGGGFRRITRAQTAHERDDQEVDEPSWARDGRYIAFVRLDGLQSRDVLAVSVHIVSATGGHERRVGPGACPSWSPDGRQLAYLAFNNSQRTIGIGIAPVSGAPSKIIRLKPAGCPAWTADGRRIVSVSGRRKVHVVDVASGLVLTPTVGERERTRLAPSASQQWSSDGKLLSVDFKENSRGQDAAVVHVRALAGAVWTFRQWHDDSPAWSPDGRHLVFVSTTNPGGIYIVGANGGRPRRLATGTNPVWSPDGTLIAFDHGYPKGNGRVFVVARDGGRARLVGAGSQPAWSPDSRWLSVSCRQGLCLLPLGGGGPVPLGAGEPCGDRLAVGRAAWSHDGTAIAFAVTTECDDIAGTGPSLAVTTRDGTRLTGLDYGDRPAWTADDREVVYISGVDSLSAHPPNGGKGRDLDDGSVGQFSLSPSRALVAYTVTREGKAGGLWLVNLDGSGARPLLPDAYDSDPAWRP